MRRNVEIDPLAGQCNRALYFLKAVLVYDTACARQTFPSLSVVGRVAWRFPIVRARPTREVFDHALREHRELPSFLYSYIPLSPIEGSGQGCP